MPSSCCVVGCKVRGGQGFHLFQFPKDEAKKNQWIKNVKRQDWEPTPHSRVCSKHFVDPHGPTIDHPYPIKEMGYEIKETRRRETATSKSAEVQSLSLPTTASRREKSKKKSPEKKSPEKKSPEKKSPEKKSPEKKSPEKKSPEKKSPKKSPEKKSQNLSEASTSEPSTSRSFPRIDFGAASVEQSPRSGKRILFKGRGITVATPTPPKSRFQDPTNPITPKRKSDIIRSPREIKRRKLELEKELKTNLDVLAALELREQQEAAAAIIEGAESALKSTEVVDEETEGGEDDVFTITPSSQEADVAVIKPSSASSSSGSAKKTSKKKKPRKKIVLNKLKKADLRKLLEKQKRKLLAARKEERFGWHRFVDDDKATRSWTGFPSFAVMSRLYEIYLKPDAEKLSLESCKKIRHPRKRQLSLEDEFLFTIIRLRTNMYNVQLAFLFKIDKTYATKIVHGWIRFLAAKLSFLVSWIRRDEMPELPKAFSLFPRCVAILDCFELQVQKCRNQAVRQKLWSKYKGRYTAKFLVVIAPNGTIMYVSPAHGGRTSDEAIVTRSTDFLNKLEPYDEIMADRGFDMRSFFTFHYRVHLRIPQFLLNNAQFLRKDVDAKKKLGRARIHVERAIGHLRTFQILSQTLPVKLFRLIDGITIICSAICNLHPPIVIDKDVEPSTQEVQPPPEDDEESDE